MDLAEPVQRGSLQLFAIGSERLASALKRIIRTSFGKDVNHNAALRADFEAMKVGDGVRASAGDPGHRTRCLRIHTILNHLNSAANEFSNGL